MAKTLKTMLLVPYIALVSIYLCYCKSEALANASRISGFTTEIIHRDSPRSPLYDPSLTREQRLAKAKQRSHARSSAIFYGRKDTPQPTVTDARGAYLLKFELGSPSRPTVAVLDTGSVLVWLECVPCRSCPRRSVPIFDPGFSTTYKEPSCGSRECSKFESDASCDARSDTCNFEVEYEDKFRATGTVATETFAFESSEGGLTFFPNMVFGCAREIYNDNDGGNGVVGLGSGPASLLSQLGYDKFSYCLTLEEEDTLKSSIMHFGSDAVVSGWLTVSTPMAKNDVYYYLTLEAISVGNQRLEYSTPELDQGGNIVIDSGTTLTLLPTKFYFDFETAIVNSINQIPVRNVGSWRLCYPRPPDLPRITLHFKGADVEWYTSNAFTRLNEDYVCLAADPVVDHAVYGNTAQINYLVGFDVTRNIVSFKHTEC